MKRHFTDVLLPHSPKQHVVGSDLYFVLKRVLSFGGEREIFKCSSPPPKTISHWRCFWGKQKQYHNPWNILQLLLSNKPALDASMDLPAESCNGRIHACFLNGDRQPVAWTQRQHCQISASKYKWFCRIHVIYQCSLNFWWFMLISYTSTKLVLLVQFSAVFFLSKGDSSDRFFQYSATASALMEISPFALNSEERAPSWQTWVLIQTLMLTHCLLLELLHLSAHHFLHWRWHSFPAFVIHRGSRTTH